MGGWAIEQLGFYCDDTSSENSLKARFSHERIKQRPASIFGRHQQSLNKESFSAEFARNSWCFWDLWDFKRVFWAWSMLHFNPFWLCFKPNKRIHLEFNLPRPIRVLAPNRCPFQAVVHQLLAAGRILFDQEQTKPIRLFHHRRMPAHANSALSETTPSCVNVESEIISVRILPPVVRSRLTPVLVPLASNQKPDVGLKAIGISVGALRLDCRRFWDLWIRAQAWDLALESALSQTSLAPSPSSSSCQLASFLVFSLTTIWSCLYEAAWRSTMVEQLYANECLLDDTFCVKQRYAQLRSSLRLSWKVKTRHFLRRVFFQVSSPSTGRQTKEHW